VGRIAGLFHEGDGENAGGDHIGDGTAGHRTHQPAADDSGFRRPAGRPSGQGAGKVDEEGASARHLQEGAKNDKDHDEGRGDGQRCSEDAFGGEVDVGDDLVDGIPAMVQKPGHVRAGIGIGQKDERQRGQRPPYGSAGRLQDKKNGGAADKVVPPGERERVDPDGDLLEEDCDIEAACEAKQ